MLIFTDINSVWELANLLKLSKNILVVYHPAKEGQNDHIHMFFYVKQWSNHKVQRCRNHLAAALGNRIKDLIGLNEWLKNVVVEVQLHGLQLLADGIVGRESSQYTTNANLVSSNLGATPFVKLVKSVISKGAVREGISCCLKAFSNMQLVHSGAIQNQLSFEEDEESQEEDNQEAQAEALRNKKCEMRWDYLENLIEKIGAESVNDLLSNVPRGAAQHLSSKCGISWKTLAEQILGK